MALIKCKECGAEISDKAAACPKCGCEMTKAKGRNILTNIVLVGIILVTLFFAMDAVFSTNKREVADFNRSVDNLHDATRKLERANGK